MFFARIPATPDLTIPHRTSEQHAASRRDEFTHHQENTTRQTGTVKWFYATKGHGFIAPKDGTKDAFVHISAIERAKLGTVRAGQRMNFEEKQARDGRTATERL